MMEPIIIDHLNTFILYLEEILKIRYTSLASEVGTMVIKNNLGKETT